MAGPALNKGYGCKKALSLKGLGLKSLGLVAVAGLLFVAAPAEQAQALSLANPIGVATAKYASDNLGATTEVRWHRWHHRHWRRHWGWRHRWHRRYYRYY
jgi:hypothetical protein